MKKLILSALALSVTTAYAAEDKPVLPEPSSPLEAWFGGDVTFDLTLGYFDRSFDDPGVDDAVALTGGGIVKYESAAYKDFKVAFAYFGSHSLGVVDRDKGRGTSFLQPDGKDIAFLGEAYLDYNNGEHQVKLGRQRLNTPLMDDHNIRLLPSSYEAAVYRNRVLENTMIELGYVGSYSGFTSRLSDFERPENLWGDDGLAYIFATTKLGDVDLRAQFIDAIDDSGSRENYRYADMNVPIKTGTKSYVKAQYGGTDFSMGDTSTMLGLKTGTTVNNIDLALVFNAIRDGNFQAVEAGPMYTDWQQGYGPYEPSNAIGAQVVFYPTDKASVKLGYVDVNGKQGSRVDQYAETNLDARYTINDASSLRVRYSIKDQDFEDASGRFDRDDFRVYYYLDF